MEIKDKTVVLTGAITGMTRKEAAKKLEEIGANVLSSVTKKTDIVFYGDKPGSKLAKAESYGIAVYDESVLHELLGSAPKVERTEEVEDDDEEVEVLQEIEDGEEVEVQGSAADPYVLKNTGGVYSCTCPAWRNQSVAIDKRTCKHLRAVRGEAAEAKRVGGSHNVRKTAKTESDKPNLLLAQKWETHVDPTGWWMSEKLDGVRAYWDGKTFWSRLGNEFLAPDWFTEHLPDWPLDGELWMDRGEFQKAVGIVKRQDRGKAWEDIKYIVFDAPDHEGEFEERVQHLKDTIGEGISKYAEVLEHFVCDGIDHLTDELKRIEELGGEGVMLREKKSKYIGSRSTTLLKVKSFHDAEAKVIGYTDGAGRHRGRIGALMLARPDGVEFKCGTGLSDHDRENPPEIGTIVTYRYQELTKAGVPRFPSYVGVRADAEWPDDAVEVNAKTEAWPGDSKAKKTKPNPKTKTNPPKKAGKVDEETTLKKHDETWHVSRSGSTISITLSSDQDAQDEFERLIGQKMKRGFVLVEGDESDAEDVETAEPGETRRCEYSDGSSNKFWEITVSGNTHLARWGRIGTSGQTKEKSFKTAEEAQKDADKQFEKKVKKGYVEV